MYTTLLFYPRHPKPTIYQLLPRNTRNIRLLFRPLGAQISSGGRGMRPFRYGKLCSDRIPFDGHSGATFLGVDGGFHVRKVNEGETSRSARNSERKLGIYLT